MQQNLKFPAQCTVIPAEELEQVSGGAPAWVGELKDQIRPYWQKAKPIWPLASSAARPLCRSLRRHTASTSMAGSFRTPCTASRTA